LEEIKVLFDPHNPRAHSDLDLPLYALTDENSCATLPQLESDVTALPGLKSAAITRMRELLATSSFASLRELLRQRTLIDTLAQFDYGLFRARVDTTAFVLRLEPSEGVRNSTCGRYFRLVKEPDAESKRLAFEESLSRLTSGAADPRIYDYCQRDFDAISGRPWVYWITPTLRQIFADLPKLQDVAEPRVGLQTSDNFRFLRYWWEVGKERIGFQCTSREECENRPERWYPYMKGGGFRRWYGKQECIINYGRNGYELKAWADPLYGNSGWSRIIKSTEFYFRRGVTYSYLTAGKFSARLSPGGFVFDVAGSSLFPNDLELTLAVLNSSFAHFCLKLINPTVNFQVGDLSRLPIPRTSTGTLRDLVRRVIELSVAESEEDETSVDFIEPPSWCTGTKVNIQRQEEQAGIEHSIGEEVMRLYNISHDDRNVIEAELQSPSLYAPHDEPHEKYPEREGEQNDAAGLPPGRLGFRWVSYSLGIALGRFAVGVEGAAGCGRFNPEIAKKLTELVDGDGIMVLDPEHSDDLAVRIIQILEMATNEKDAMTIVQTATGIPSADSNTLRVWLRGYFKEHFII
jgi:hypothetical protein